MLYLQLLKSILGLTETRFEDISLVPSCTNLSFQSLCAMLNARSSSRRCKSMLLSSVQVLLQLSKGTAHLDQLSVLVAAGLCMMLRCLLQLGKLMPQSLELT